MAQESSIEWTDATWNPVTGCTKVSQGCKHCYAERMAKRLHAMGVPQYASGFEVTEHVGSLEVPLKWKKARRIFVNSMSDLFHESVSIEFIARVFDVMNQTPQHQYQVLTKRAERLAEVARQLRWTPNIWMGVSVEDERVIDRIHFLQSVPCSVRFLSLEPLIGPLERLPLTGIDWVIVGGESGPGARPMKREWVDQIRRQCRRHDIAFFFKQWGGVRKSKTGRSLNGRTYDEFPRPRHVAF